MEVVVAMKKNVVQEPEIELFAAHEAYTLSQIAERLRVSPYVVRTARLAGSLRVINLGGQGRGADYRAQGSDVNHWLTTLREPIQK